VPLLLGADTLTEAVATAIPSADREEKVSRTDRGSHILYRVQCCVCKAFRVGLEFHKPFSSTRAYSHQRCMVGSGGRFVDDSALEEGGFELVVPL
jgi:hypothetical protein